MIEFTRNYLQSVWDGQDPCTPLLTNSLTHRVYDIANKIGYTDGYGEIDSTTSKTIGGLSWTKKPGIKEAFHRQISARALYALGITLAIPERVADIALEMLSMQIDFHKIPLFCCKQFFAESLKRDIIAGIRGFISLSHEKQNTLGE
jgi:hypothetical protein